MIKPKDPDDIFLWPDGTQCSRDDYERGGYAHMSDDFEVIPVDTERHKAVAEES